MQKETDTNIAQKSFNRTLGTESSETAHSKSAVLFFSLSPAAEVRQKKFLSESDRKKEIHLASLLRNHCLEQVDKTGLPVFVFDEQNQRGDSFGERFSNAFADVFASGYDHIIAVGSDTPELSFEHILAAEKKLSEKNSDVVLGPATDGGTWLMAISASAFQYEIFSDFAWRSRRLLKELMNHYSVNYSIDLLHPLNDVDDASDVYQFLRTESGNTDVLSLIYALKSLFQKARLILKSSSFSFKSTFVLSGHALRGPPYLR
jgi:glycosyltransferase A (GT-A) superfamily protein (DUF2064 family)